MGIPSATLAPLALKACICTKLMYVEPPVLATLMADTVAHVGGGDGVGDGDGGGNGDGERDALAAHRPAHGLAAANAGAPAAAAKDTLLGELSTR